MIVGSGFLNKWEGYWCLLPFALEKIWLRIEYISTRRFADFNQIEDEISSLKPPDSDWSEYESQSRPHVGFQFSHENSALPNDLRHMEKRISGLAKSPEIFVPLDNGPSNDPLKQVGLWHFYLQKYLGEMPHAVFMGGVPQEAYLAVFKRPLTPKDFVRLWTISSMGATENGTIIPGKGTH
jgi:type VI secretion system protein VasJ